MAFLKVGFVGSGPTLEDFQDFPLTDLNTQKWNSGTLAEATGSPQVEKFFFILHFFFFFTFLCCCLSVKSTAVPVTAAVQSEGREKAKAKITDSGAGETVGEKYMSSIPIQGCRLWLQAQSKEEETGEFPLVVHLD